MLSTPHMVKPMMTNWGHCGRDGSMNCGVSAAMKTIAFGLVRLTSKPSMNKPLAAIETFSASISSGGERHFWMPIQMRYAAPRSLTASKANVDVRSKAPRPRATTVSWMTSAVCRPPITRTAER